MSSACRRFLGVLGAAVAVTAAAVPSIATAATGVSARAKAASTLCANATTQPDAMTPSQAQAATLCLMNAERSVRGLRSFRAHPILAKVASGFAQQMAEQQFFDHASPGGSTLLSRVKSTSYLNGSAQWSLGENIAWGTGSLSTPRATVASWMKSPPHRKNLLAAQFTEVGIGIAAGGATKNVNPDGLGSTYVTDFGQRSATAQLAKAKLATK